MLHIINVVQLCYLHVVLLNILLSTVETTSKSFKYFPGRPIKSRLREFTLLQLSQEILQKSYLKYGTVIFKAPLRKYF